MNDDRKERFLYFTRTEISQAIEYICWNNRTRFLRFFRQFPKVTIEGIKYYELKESEILEAYSASEDKANGSLQRDSNLYYALSALWNVSSGSHYSFGDTYRILLYKTTHSLLIKLFYDGMFQRVEIITETAISRNQWKEK